jgi:hypothetical protein
VQSRGGERGNRRWGKELTCGPQLTASARERRGALALVGRAGFVGRKKRGRRGLDGPREEGKRKKEKERWAGPRVEVRWVGFVFFFFFFKSISNQFQTLLNSNLYTNFHIFLQLFLRTFSQIF